MKVTVTYDQLKARATRKGNCTKCGGKTTRSYTFTATVNPWNTVKTGEDMGRPKTYGEVQRDVWEKARDWDPAPEWFNHVNECPERKS